MRLWHHRAMKAAIGQFAVAATADENLDIARDLIGRAAGCDLLVLPESILSRDIADPAMVRRAAQPLDGPFVTALLVATQGTGLTVTFCIHEPGGPDGRVFNTHVALRDGEIVAAYRKLHLYDAFHTRESDNVLPGDDLPPVIEVAGMKVGLMTCYDVRFPEVARYLTLQGAEVLALPAAWVRGPAKERHWEVMVTARALENTCWVIACGECGPRNIGESMAVDPLGVIVARTGAEPALLTVEIDPDRTRHARQVLPVLANRRFAAPRMP